MFANSRVGGQFPGLARLETLPEQVRDEARLEWAEQGLSLLPGVPRPLPHSLRTVTLSLVLVPSKQHLCPHPRHTREVALRLRHRDLAMALFRRQHWEEENESNVTLTALR